MKGTKAFVALLLVVGLLAVGISAVSVPAEASGTEGVIEHTWVVGGDPDPTGADKTGDKGLLVLGETGEFTLTLTENANATDPGTNQLIIEGQPDSIDVLNTDTTVARATGISGATIDVETEGVGRAGFAVILEYDGDTYYHSVFVEVIEEDIDDEGLEETPEEQFFSDMDIAPAAIVITMIVIALALPILLGGFMSLVLAMFFAVFAALWFVGLVPVMIVVAGFIISMMASLVEGVFG